MLKRSPRSRISTIVIGCMCVLAAYFALEGLVTLHSLSHRYGARRTYFEATRLLSQGKEITSQDFTTHTMFSSDAPVGALSGSHAPLHSFAQSTIVRGTILTKEMVADSATESVNSTRRIVFVPTKDMLSSSISNVTDLLSVSPDGYGARYLARNAKILFGLTPQGSADQDTDHGYFVDVAQDEAEKITEALSQGDVRFALRATNH